MRLNLWEQVKWAQAKWKYPENFVIKVPRMRERHHPTSSRQPPLPICTAPLRWRSRSNEARGLQLEWATLRDPGGRRDETLRPDFLTLNTKIHTPNIRGYLLKEFYNTKIKCLLQIVYCNNHGRRVCKAHLGTCLGDKNWGAFFEAPRGTAKS